MNVEIIHKAHVADAVLDSLAEKLPSIISGLLEVPGGKMAILKPEQISLQFTQASTRDSGSEVRIIVLARSIGPRTSHGNKLAEEILEQVMPLLQKYSLTVRLYLTEIGAAEHAPA